ncbi:MAG: amidohydrolase family protein [Microbacterium sp.]|nr:amidohydrolase family protein [Microbacterium sp.]
MTVDPDRSVIRDGAVVIEGARIIAVGKAADVEPRYPGAERIDAKGQLLLPGFINLHVHCAINVTRGIGDDMGGAPIYRRDIPQGVMMSAEDTRIMSKLGATQAMALGSTTIVENYIHSRANVEALAEVGIRAVVSERVHDADLFSVRYGSYTYDEERGRRLLAENEELIREWHGYDGGRITCQVGPHGPDTASPDLLRRARALADETGVGIFMHVGQSAGELAQVRQMTGRSSVQHLADLGVLGQDLIAGHCAFLDDRDAELLAESRTTVCHLPTVNAKSGWMAPIPELRHLGARVGLGTDNMVHDMIETMRFAVCINRANEGTAENIKAMDALEMATIVGARALGREADLGSIEEGKLADLLLIDLDRINLAPVLDPIASLVYAGQAADIHSVMIGGKFTVRDRRVLTLDPAEVVSEAQDRAERLWADVAGWQPIDGATGTRC